MVINMKKTFIIWAFVFAAIWAFKHLLPQSSENFKSAFSPTFISEDFLKDSIEAAGRLLSGEHGVIYAWEGGGENNKAPVQKADVSNDFPLETMIYKNLHGFSLPQGYIRPSATIFVSQGEPRDDFGSADTLAKALTCGFVPSAADSPDLLSDMDAKGSPAPSEGGSALPPLDVADDNTAVLDEFIARQTAFAQTELPANVLCEFPTLPFNITAPALAEIGSPFGYRIHPIYGDLRFHYGTDFNLNYGEEIYAFADGTVIAAQQFDGYGNTIILSHEDGYSSLYAHCSNLHVSYGDRVKAGELIALSGQSGNVTGPHLHFELLRNGLYLNPEFYL